MSDIKTDDLQDSTLPAPEDALDVSDLDTVAGGTAVHVHEEARVAPHQPKL